jgi:hypothetical protein
VYSKAKAHSFRMVRIMFAVITLSVWIVVYMATYIYNVGSVPITIKPTNSPNDPNKLFYIDF